MRPLLLLMLASALWAPACDDNRTFPETPAAYEGLQPEPLACIPNLDGRIDAHELMPALDELTSYRVSPALPVGSSEGARFVDTVGTIDEEGRRVWDWSGEASDDRVVTLEAQPLVDQWYATSFPGGEFAVPSDAAGRLHGVYSHSEGGLLLHGVASALMDPPEGRTLMVYTQPVVFLPFPLTLGLNRVQTGEVRNGTLNGLTPWSQDDVYEVTVDGSGELRLPDFTFTQALRVQTRVEVRPKAGTKQGFVQHQVSFFFECFGEVARATSPVALDPADDPGSAFNKAAEVRRLGWF